MDGCNEGTRDGRRDGVRVGNIDGFFDGASVGDTDGLIDGKFEGLFVGSRVGKMDGRRDGNSVGDEEGRSDGAIVGVIVGRNDGGTDGMSVGTTVGNSDGPADCNIDGRRDGASDGTKVGVSDGLLDVVGIADVDGAVVAGVFDEGILGRVVGTKVGNSDDPRTEGAVEGIVIAVGVELGDADGTRISLHRPHVRSLRTLGYLMQVFLQSAVPAVPLCMNQPCVKSIHPSGIGLHSPARSEEKAPNKLPKPRNRLPNSPSSSSIIRRSMVASTLLAETVIEMIIIMNKNASDVDIVTTDGTIDICQGSRNLSFFVLSYDGI
jgi:hypothetical protein